MTNLGTRVTTTIHAPVETVWEAITTPALMKQWFFGVDTETTWAEGSPIVHRGEYQGQPYVDKGRILRFRPPHELVHTHWSSVSGVPDTPENYQTVTWALAKRDGGTELTVTDDNIRSEDARTASEEGWRTALEALAALVES